MGFWIWLSGYYVGIGVGMLSIIFGERVAKGIVK